MKRYVTVLLIAVIAGTLLLAGCGRGLVMPLSNLALAQLLIEQVSDASETQANDDTPADLEQGPTAIVLPAPTPNLFTPLKPVDIALPREPKVPPTIVPTPITQTAKIIANTLNFREGPGLGYSVIDTLAHGTKLVIIGVNADCSWLKVHNRESSDEFAGVEGWISAATAYVEFERIRCADFPIGTFRPPSGTLLVSEGSGYGELTIHNGTRWDGRVMLGESQSSIFLSVYVRGGEQVLVNNIRDGEYIIYYQLGAEWNGSTFVEEHEGARFVEPAEFTTAITNNYINYSTISLTLHPVVGGTAKTVPVDLSQQIEE